MSNGVEGLTDATKNVLDKFLRELKGRLAV